MTPVNWTHETEVHRAIKVTDNLRNSNQFVGTQDIIVRDETRRRTFVATIETDGLYLYLVVDAKVVSRSLVHEGVVRRVHLALRKFDGAPVVAYSAQSAGGGWELRINGARVGASSGNADFPFLSFQQPPIGLPAPTPPEHLVLTF